MFNFQSSLKIGQKGEAVFHSMFPQLIATDGKREDFIMPCGRMVELKCESRSTAQTANLAVELNSSEDRPGAVERAAADGISYLVYLYADGVYFVYSPAALLAYVYEAKHRTVMVPNKTYKTLVMLVPRDAVAHLDITAEFNKEVA